LIAVKSAYQVTDWNRK